MEIKVYAYYCCGDKHPLQTGAEEAMDTLNIQGSVELVTDRSIIEKEGLVNLPILSVDGRHVITGRNAYPNEIRHLLLDMKYNKP